MIFKKTETKETITYFDRALVVPCLEQQVALLVKIKRQVNM